MEVENKYDCAFFDGYINVNLRDGNLGTELDSCVKIR